MAWSPLCLPPSRFSGSRSIMSLSAPAVLTTSPWPLGCFLGSQLSAALNDRIYIRLKKRNNNNNTEYPECVAPMVPGALLVPAGLFIYGWSARYETHWVAPNIGPVIYCAGTIVNFRCVQIYLVDTYQRYAASALASVTVLRSLAGFGFPLFAPYMYDRLGFGWGNSMLGFLAIVLGLPAPFLLWRYGERLRARSTFAAA